MESSSTFPFVTSPPLPADWEQLYQNRSILVTGGLGFIGSNLSLRLVELGARVTIVDSLIPDYGGNPWNVEKIKDRININIADVRDPHSIARLVQGQDIIFNLAGQVSHIDSMRDPFTDLEINCRSQLSILEACRNNNSNVKIIYAGTRQQYGKPQYLPVDEKHLVLPTDVNGINKTAGETYHILYNNVHGIRATSLRMTNTYGPRLLLKHNRQGFISVFLRTAIEKGEIKIFGTGEQLRDLNYVDDATDAFLRVGVAEWTNGEVYNLGGDEILSVAAIAQKIIKTAGAGRLSIVPFPEETRRIDIGSYYGSYQKLREAVGWRPLIDADEGFQRTVDYYRENISHYVED
ncbi:MAG: NAD-dependent epimerase/dehydratase family protein [Candidatus Eisenbacteria bacterium]|uniref:NAD-dependent epimerase/dehydratase family protein n=1 Tax=Eiseniibacteriota bacterium TaxID=2212470 RepID=A0A948RSD2_UNCEI|nr:NAD-dependent epimerase/dehydratase family protein [Candidatus Eisenbacteria bacterium]MBU1949491.1 NAD-dependent epimerase/dehydratase family protein [Candidatus Eisenbacteria bacterium]MBU2689721.1 NAD-dependent epimerase/dehydratase family protein [Candidatus Eisenbacteria bacterium]